jgi:biopolymer transport protein ExbD
MGRASKTEGCELNMTPMIDVVFQLMIFFIVTISISENYNPEIQMEDAKHGPIIKDQDPRTLIIEVNRLGWIFLQGIPVTKQTLRDLLKYRYDRLGEYPILLRGDRRTPHKDIRAVMDICTRAGIWRISFAAIQEHKVPRGE